MKIVQQRNTRGLQIPLSFSEDECDAWRTIALDLTSLLRQEKECDYKCMRGLKICANLTIRGVFTSDIAYSTKVERPLQILSLMVHLRIGSTKGYGIVNDARSSTVSHPLDPAGTRGPKVRIDYDRVFSLVEVRSPPDSEVIRRPRIPIKHKPKTTKAISQEEHSVNAHSTELETLSEDRRNETPLLTHCFTNGFTGEYTNLMLWVPNSEEVVFAAGNVIVFMNSTSTLTKTTSYIMV